VLLEITSEHCRTWAHRKYWSMCKNMC